MEALPNEIIEHILIDSNLTIVDIVNFSSTCSKFREVVNSNNSLWKKKYFQRWPKTDFDVECEDWHNECISRRCFEKQVLELLSFMSSKFFDSHNESISGFQLDFTSSLTNSHKYGYYYLRDYLIYINSLPLTKYLTNKYYGNILLKYIHKKHCKEVWNSLILLDDKEQTLEKGAMFVSLWCPEYERGIWNTVTSELDATANKIKQHLLHCFPDHPLKNVPEDVQLLWRRENIPGNMFQPQDCKSIIWAINYVLFKELKYCVAYDFNDFTILRKQFGIYYAVQDRKANPIIFAVIHESIARRLGVKIEVLEFLNHCLLRWKENYSVEDSPIHYISTSSEVIFMTSRCPRNSTNKTVMPACNMQQVAQRVALCLYPRENEDHFSVRDAFELLLVINPFNFECYQRLYRFLMRHRMDAREVIAKLKEIQSQISSVEWRRYEPLLQTLEVYQQDLDRFTDSDRSRIVNNRVEGVDFAVGMVVRDKLSGRTGIIYGWTLKVWTPPGVPSHAFYNILVEGGSYSFSPQRSLQILHSPPFISHPSLGRFFDEFCMTYYKPNKELQALYPQEMDALQNILKRDRQN